MRLCRCACLRGGGRAYGCAHPPRRAGVCASLT
jgi:hypothetical protein